VRNCSRPSTSAPASSASSLLSSSLSSTKRSQNLKRSSPLPVSSHLRPQDFLLALPVGAVLEEMLPCLGSVRAPPAPGGGPDLHPLGILASETVTRLQLVDSGSELLVRIGRDEVGLCRSFRLYRYSLWVTLTPAHAFASFHLISVIERFKWARDLGGSAPHTSLRTQGIPRHERPARLPPASPTRPPFRSQAPLCGGGTAGVQSPLPASSDGGWRCASWLRAPAPGRAGHP
jgi:hypothetical protein